VIARHLTRLAAVAAVTTWTLLVAAAGLPTASAAPCPDVEALFARGTFAPPGLGGTGKDFVNALRSKIGGKSLGTYAVVYPASTDFPTAVDGIRDASNHVEQMVAACPDTKLVLAGYSQGAAVMGFVTANAVPGGVDPADVPEPMPADVASHVAAVALLGKPDAQFMRSIDSPQVTIGPLYATKTIELCAPGDPICSEGDDGDAHTSYTANGMVEQAAAYVAGRV
jgi:cutinase